MKNIYTSILAIASVFSSYAQSVNDSISMEALYTNQVFYSLDNGEVANISNNDWELGFSMHGNGAAGSAIILNEATTTLWAYPGDTTDWASLDTAGHASWEQLLNSDTSWTNGAFNKYRGEGGMFDMGWGVLNPQNNYFTFGDSLYIAKLKDGSYRKIWIVSLKSKKWECKYADINGNNEQVFTIDKLNYENRNFVYRSMITNQTLDREPDNTTWDLMFVKHTDYISFPGVYVAVTGVFSNKNVWTAKSQELDYATAITATSAQTNFNQKTNNIGYSWKKYSSSTGWTVYDSTAYFLYDNDSTDFYRIVFNGFGGMGTGKAFFNTERLATVNINDLNSTFSYSVFPNPATNQISILMDNINSKEVSVSIYNLSGQSVFQSNLSLTQGVNQKQLDISSLSSGVYVINISNNRINSSKKLIIK